MVIMTYGGFGCVFGENVRSVCQPCIPAALPRNYVVVALFSINTSLQAYTVLKTTFTQAEVSALCEEALEKGFQAFNKVAGDDTPADGESADDPSFQPALSRAGRRKRKNKTKAATHPTLSSFLDQAQGAGATGTFVHPEPPPSKKKKTTKTKGSNGDGGSIYNPAAGVALVDGTGPGETETETEAETEAEAQAENTFDNNLAGEVRVARECGVADKKGQRHQITRPRTVSTSFGQVCVDAYLGLVRSALSQKMDDLANGAPNKCPDGGGPSSEGLAQKAGSATTVTGKPSVEDMMMVADGNGGDDDEDGDRRAAAKEEVVGVISYTEELSKNVVRTGVPPPLPKYTKVAMWRGEDVCLNQLGAGDMEEVLVGIAWCEPKGLRRSVDLDLSVMVSSTGLVC